MIPEAVILGRDIRVNKILRNLIVGNKKTVFLCVETLVLNLDFGSYSALPVSPVHRIYRRTCVLIAHIHVKIVHASVNIVVYIIKKRAAHNRSGDNSDKQKREEDVYDVRQHLQCDSSDNFKRTAKLLLPVGSASSSAGRSGRAGSAGRTGITGRASASCTAAYNRLSGIHRITAGAASALRSGRNRPHTALRCPSGRLRSYIFMSVRIIVSHLGIHLHRLIIIQ